MDVLVCNEDEELIEQLDSPILAINDFIVKEDLGDTRRIITGENACTGFSWHEIFWGQKSQ